MHDFPGVYRALLELLTRKTSSLPTYLGTQGISGGLREAIHWYSLLESAGGDSWIHLRLEQLEELSAIVSAWSTRASGPTLRKLRTNHALRKIGPQPDVFSTLLSMHGLMVRQIGVPGVHTSRSDFNKQTHGSMHRTDGTFEIALTFNSHDFQPPKEQP